MATIYDIERFEKIMADAKANPYSCYHIGGLCISYLPSSECWRIVVDGDFTVFFDRIEYSSNTLNLYRLDMPIAYFTHSHQRLERD